MAAQATPTATRARPAAGSPYDGLDGEEYRSPAMAALIARHPLHRAAATAYDRLPDDPRHPPPDRGRAVWGYFAEILSVIQWFIILFTGQRNAGHLGPAVRVPRVLRPRARLPRLMFDEYPAVRHRAGSVPGHVPSSTTRRPPTGSPTRCGSSGSSRRCIIAHRPRHRRLRRRDRQLVHDPDHRPPPAAASSTSCSACCASTWQLQRLRAADDRRLPEVRRRRPGASRRPARPGDRHRRHGAGGAARSRRRSGLRRLRAPPPTAGTRRDYLRNRLVVLSASTLPPVWHVGQ